MRVLKHLSDEYAISQISPNKLNSLLLTKFPQILNTLLTQINVLHIRCIRSGCSGHSTSHNHRISLKYDTIVADLIDRQGDKVVIIMYRSLVSRISSCVSLALPTLVTVPRTSITNSNCLAMQGPRYTTRSRSPACHRPRIASHHFPS